MLYLLTEEELKPYYTIPQYSFKKSAFFEISYPYNKWKCRFLEDWKEHNQIALNVFLGMLPDHSSPIFVKNEEQVSLVVSLNTYDELSKDEIVSPTEWRKKDIQHIHLTIPDFTDKVLIKDFINALQTVRAHVEKGEKVFIHCKAGRARSAMFSLVYLCIYGNGDDLLPNQSVDAVLKYLQSKRVQVSMAPEQIKKAIDIVALITEQEVLVEFSTYAVEHCNIDEYKEDYHTYLASLHAKNSIRHFSSFKELALEGFRVQHMLSECARYINICEFFNSILESKDGFWFDILRNQEGPLWKYINSNPSGDSLDARTKRNQLVQHFIEEVEMHLEKLGFVVGKVQAMTPMHDEDNSIQQFEVVDNNSTQELPSIPKKIQIN